MSQRKTAKNVGLSPSTVQNIVKIFRESGEIWVCKSQGWMSPHFSLFLGKTDVRFTFPCYQWKVQKRASVIVPGCISAHGMCEGTIDAEAYVGILETYAAIKTTTFPWDMSISAGQCQALSALVTTAWLLRRACAWLSCLQSRSVSYIKCMAHHEEENQTTATKDSWAAG